MCADIDMEVLSKMRSVRGEMGELIWLCCECDYSHIKKTNTFRHVEAKHVVCEYLCPICNQPNSCRNALKQHMIRFLFKMLKRLRMVFEALYQRKIAD